MRALFRVTVTMLLAPLAIVSTLSASSSPVFDEIMKPYERIRLALLEDSVAGVAENAKTIRALIETADEENLSSKDIQQLLPKVATFADDLAAAEDLALAREAFYEMSKMLVQFRAKIHGDDLPVVMYCSMAKKSWLQSEGGEVGNPYHGRAMAKCGDVVGG